MFFVRLKLMICDWVSALQVLCIRCSHVGHGIALFIFFTTLRQTLHLELGVLTDSFFFGLGLMFLSLLGCLCGQSELKAKVSIFLGGTVLKGNIS